MSSHQQLRSTLFGCLVLATLPVLAQEPTYKLDIEAQPLASALTMLAEQSKLQVVYFSVVVEGKHSPAVSGTMTAAEAMALLLGNTDLTFETLADDTLVIEAKSPAELAEETAASTSAPPLTVRDQNPRTSWDRPQRRKPLLEEIIVTGSNIRSNAMDATPLIQFDRNDILKTGYSTIDQLLGNLPQNFAVQSLQGVGGGVNLRGLGTDSTLILINGRRVASLPGYSVNLSMIPLSVVERVDVLTDGASAIYGSDAVGGVVNVVLSDEFEGTQLLLRHAPDINDLSETVIGLTSGAAWSSGNAFASYEFAESDKLLGADRGLGDLLQQDLLPATERHSFFGSARQELNDSLGLASTGFFSERDTHRGYTLSGEDNWVEDRLYGATLGLHGEMTNGWGHELSGTYSKAEKHNAYSKSDLMSWTIDGKIDGTLSMLPGGDAKIALGAQLRGEKCGFAAVTNSSDRNVYAVHGEMHIPLFGEGNRTPGIYRLNLNTAVRHEAYSGDVGSSTDPRLDVLWSPVAGFNLRGSWGTSFHAPSLPSLNTQTVQGYLIGVRDPMAIDPLGLLPMLLVSGGNAELEPEKATTWALGFDIQPESISGLDIGVTYFDIEYRDRIGLPSSLPNLLTNPDVAELLTLNPGQELIDSVTMLPGGFRNNTPNWTPEDAIAVFDGRQRNLSSTTVRGIDLDAAYSFSSRIGEWTFNLNGNYLFDMTHQASASSRQVSVLDTRYNPVDLHLRGGASWENDRVLASLSLNYTAGYLWDFHDDSSGTPIRWPGPAVDSWTTIDLQLRYDFRQRPQGLFSNSAISVSAQNLLNEGPPPVETTIGFDWSNASPLGRLVSLQLTKSW